MTHEKLYKALTSSYSLQHPFMFSKLCGQYVLSVKYKEYLPISLGLEERLALSLCPIDGSCVLSTATASHGVGIFVSVS